MFATITLFVVLTLAYGLRTTVSGLIVIGVIGKIMQSESIKNHISSVFNSAISRLNNAVNTAKGLRIMYANTESVTLSANALNNPALLLAELLNQGFTISKDSPMTILGGGNYNPAIVIWTNFVKNYPPEQWQDILIKRESVLSDYYSLLRDDGLAKEKIQARVDSARQFYIEYGKHNAEVSRRIGGIGAENDDSEKIRVTSQIKRGDMSTSVPTVGEVYTVNDSPTLMVKFTKALANGIRVAMVKGEPLPKNTTVRLAGVIQQYTVSAVVGKTMTLTPKLANKTQPTESVKPTAKTSGRVAGMPAT